MSHEILLAASSMIRTVTISSAVPCWVRDAEALYQNKLQELVQRSGLDLSPCRICGETIICLPDGLACCEPCADKVGA
jgi:hypothetical protein